MDENDIYDLFNQSTNFNDELFDYNFEPTAAEIIRDSLAIIFVLAGLVSDIIIILMIARNARMRNKTNLLLMNIAINDAFFLICNIHFLVPALQIFGENEHFSFHTNCVLRVTDVAFQFNQLVFLLILISNTLVKNKRLQIKWLLIITYTSIITHFFLNIILCYYNVWNYLFVVGFIIFVSNIVMLLFKEFNNCYKNWYRKDPLSPRTRFRINIGRIYMGNYFFTFLCYLIDNFVFIVISMHCFLTSLYILIYIVYSDKNFKICLLNLLQCKGAGEYDVNATITFAEEVSEDGQDQVNIDIANSR